MQNSFPIGTFSQERRNCFHLKINFPDSTPVFRVEINFSNVGHWFLLEFSQFLNKQLWYHGRCMFCWLYYIRLFVKCIFFVSVCSMGYTSCNILVHWLCYVNCRLEELQSINVDHADTWITMITAMTRIMIFTHMYMRDFVIEYYKL